MSNIIFSDGRVTVTRYSRGTGRPVGYQVTDQSGAYTQRSAFDWQELFALKLQRWGITAGAGGVGMDLTPAEWLIVYAVIAADVLEELEPAPVPPALPVTGPPVSPAEHYPNGGSRRASYRLPR